MVWLPAARPAVTQLAVRMLPLPASAIAEQPLIDVPPSLKLTVPVGALPLTVPVNVTLVPTVEGVSDVAMLVVLVVPFTVCDSALLLDPAFTASPLYVATMLCVPAVRALVTHAAVRALPLPETATAEHPLIELPPSLKLTVPVGLLPVTVAVKDTAAPALEGLGVLVSVVVVLVVPAPLVTLTVTALELALVTMMFTPYVLSR